MTFLQPSLLLGLPAVLLPVLIHLLNRLRYRSVPWAAMMFLISATRSAARRARLRHYLILLCRALAVLFFILALARPLAGGWLGLVASGSPETVVVLLDRSASMETTDPRTQTSKRVRALNVFTDAAKHLRATSRFVLIENVLRKPQEIGGMAAMDGLSLASPTDTAADLPAMFRSAIEYLMANRVGRSEIWVASDLQKSNWRPDSAEWQKIAVQIASMQQDAQVRVLALRSEISRNASVALRSAERRTASGKPHLSLVLDMNRSAATPASFPMIVTLDGNRSQVGIQMDGTFLRYAWKTELGPEKKAGGWGKVEIPADENASDNSCWFVYGEDLQTRSILASASPLSSRFLRFGLAPASGRLSRVCDVVQPDKIDGANLKAASMVVWQAPPPAGPQGQSLFAFAEAGGAVVFFPPGTGASAAAASNDFGIAWTPVEPCDERNPFRVSTWDENDGPLAKTDNGLNLPMDGLTVKRRQNVAGIAAATDGEAEAAGAGSEWYVLARFADGKPFLARRRAGDGVIFVCTTLPQDDWSNLGEGKVLVPMLQRIARVGGERMQQFRNETCGEWKPSEEQTEWASVESNGHRDCRWNAGVYRSGTRLVAVNRPVAEDDPEVVDKDRIERLFGDVRAQVVEEMSGAGSGRMEGEIWRLLIYLAVGFLIAEGCLLLGEKTPRVTSGAESGGAER